MTLSPLLSSVLAVSAVLALTGAPGPLAAEEASAFDHIKINAGQALFEAECRRCHAVDPSDPSYGPLLEGVIGRRAGTFDGYEYSEALKNAGFVWTPGALRAWMEDNDGLVPGTKMRHVGIDDPTVQDFILTYLASISG
jgi:cytochrome c